MNPSRLAGRVVIVTGAGHGLGRAYAHHLAGEGAHVAVVDIAPEAARDVAGAIGDRADAYVADVTDRSAMDAVVAALCVRFGRVDGLVNNAGGALVPAQAFDRISPDAWAQVLAVNLTGQWICACAVADVMRRAKYGKIVNVSSATVARGEPVGLAPYIAAKAGVVGLTRALARELGPANVCVNAVAPGYVPVDTPKAVHSPDAAEALRRRMIAEQCLPRTETPEDLCGLVAFLCSAESDFVTGQVINVDGGWTS